MTNLHHPKRKRNVRHHVHKEFQGDKKHIQVSQYAFIWRHNSCDLSLQVLHPWLWANDSTKWWKQWRRGQRWKGPSKRRNWVKMPKWRRCAYSLSTKGKWQKLRWTKCVLKLNVKSSLYSVRESGLRLQHLADQVSHQGMGATWWGSQPEPGSAGGLIWWAYVSVWRLTWLSCCAYKHWHVLPFVFCHSKQFQ